MISKHTYQFLKELKKNNNRNWFQDNKSRFLEIKSDFEAFVQDLIAHIAVFDPSISHLEPKECIFRIYRDTRFSKDKSPYKTNLGAHLIAPVARPHDRAGYYVHIEPKNSFLAGGAYLPPAVWLKAIRQAIDENGNELKKILKDKNFKKYFGEMEGDKLKTIPRDYPADHPFIDLLRYKSFLAMHQVNDEDAMSEPFLKHAVQVFKALKPFDDFLNNALD